MEIEIIYGQVIAKANNYQAVPGKDGQKRIIKNERIREYERSFCLQCKKYRGKRISGRFKLFIRVWHGNIRFDLDNALKTILDCLQMVEAITNDSLCFEIHAEKRIDRRNPRVEFGLEEINEQKIYLAKIKRTKITFICQMSKSTKKTRLSFSLTLK